MSKQQQPTPQQTLRRLPAVYPADIDLGQYPNKCHIDVWSQVCEKQDDPCAEVALVGDFPVFARRRDRDRFVRWWRCYSVMFGQVTAARAVLPSPPHGNMRHPPTVITISYQFETQADVAATLLGLAKDRGDGAQWDANPIRVAVNEVRDDWALITSCNRSPVWRIPGAWLFSRSSDAVQFQLRRNVSRA